MKPQPLDVWIVLLHRAFDTVMLSRNWPTPQEVQGGFPVAMHEEGTGEPTPSFGGGPAVWINKHSGCILGVVPYQK